MSRARRLVQGTVAVSATAGLLAGAAAGAYPHGTTRRASAFALAFAARYNEAQVGRERVSGIYCAENGALFDCGLMIRREGRRPRCGVVRVDSSYRVWGQRRLPCPAAKSRVPVA